LYRKVLELALQSADHLVALGEDEAAANILQHYVDIHPPHPLVFQRLGRLRLKQGRAAEAARLLERALAMGDVRRPAGTIRLTPADPPAQSGGTSTEAPVEQPRRNGTAADQPVVPGR
jgi:hypothetical protein